jgi:branched-chain amino acid transport system ATP-binding protein
MTQFLKIDGLCKSFGGLNAICDLNFELAEGEILSLIEPNGSGKTTTL